MSSKDTEVVKTIESLKRANNSVNGNPSWIVTCTDGTVLRTQSDASVSYALDNPNFRNVPVRFTLTAAGRIRYAKPEPGADAV
jgi:hypothetical protein